MCNWHQQVQPPRWLSEHSRILQVQVQVWLQRQWLWMLWWDPRTATQNYEFRGQGCLLICDKTSQKRCFKSLCLGPFLDENSQSDRSRDVLWPHISFWLFKLQQTTVLPRLVSCFKTPLIFTDVSERATDWKHTCENMTLYGSQPSEK